MRKANNLPLGKSRIKNTVISEGAVNAIYHSEIISTTPNTPKNHTAFNYREAEPMQGTQAERFLVLHMETVNGKARSSEEIKASMVQTYTMPMDFNDMTDRIERYNRANGIIFSPESLSSRELKPHQCSLGPQNPNQSLWQHGRRLLHENHVRVGHQSQPMAPRMHGT
jgi:hypothetical protein